MKTSHSAHLGNQLARIRESKNLKPLQVATLLGYKNANPVLSFEKGRRIPDLKTALKFAAIYSVPIRVMLDEYYEACREEVRHNAVGKFENDELSYFFKFCSFEEKLGDKTVTSADLKNVRQHSTDLIRKTAEKLGHI